MMFIPPWHIWGACGSGIISSFLLFIIIIIIVIITTCGCGHPCLTGLLVNHFWTPFGGGGSFCLIIILHVSTPECQSVTLYRLSFVSSSFFMAYVWVFFNCSVISLLILGVCDSWGEWVSNCGELKWPGVSSCLV